MMKLIGTLVVASLFAATSYGLFQFRQKMQNSPTSQSSSRPLMVAAVSCLIVFILVNVSDWPGTVLAQFWAEHAIFAATASTLPLVGVGYFAFEAHDQHIERELDGKVAATGRGGLVDHLVDVDVALALLSWDWADVERRWPAVNSNGRPLRWLRHQRQLLGREGLGILETDPRFTRHNRFTPHDEEHRDLIDQCVRRIMAGIKEWGPLLARSQDGRKDLVSLGELRLALLPISDRSNVLSMADVSSVQMRCRELASSFENRSVGGASVLARPEVLNPQQEVPSPQGATS